MEQKTIGSFIAVLRKASGMTQKQLAEKLCVSDKTVSRWERNETTPDLSLIPVIAEIFNITSDELLRGERRTQSAVPPVPEVRNEKQVQRLLSAANARHTTRMVLSSAIALLGWIIAFLMNGSYQYRDFSIIVALVCAFIGIVLQVIGSINLFSSVHSEEFDGPQFVRLKRHILGSTGLVTGATAFITAFIVPILNVRVRLDSYSNHDQMDGVVSGAVWGFVTLVLWTALYFLVKYFISEHGHSYLKD